DGATIRNMSALAFAGRGGVTSFGSTSTAANATIINHGASFAGAVASGSTSFTSLATAGNAMIANGGGSAPNALGGTTSFLNSATASRSNITNLGGIAAGSSGGETQFTGKSTAQFATITTNGGTTAGAGGGQLTFRDTATAASATLITNGGTNGGSGGRTVFLDQASGGSSRVITNAGGTFDISGSSNGAISAGAISGAGDFVLGPKRLNIVGYTAPSASLTSDAGNPVYEVSGTISGIGGSLDLAAAQTLILSGVNSYNGPTLVSAAGAVLQMDGSLASSFVYVRNHGQLSGNGRFAGSLIIGSASGATGTIAPGDNGIGAFSTAGWLSLDSTAVFRFELNSDTLMSDRVTVNGLSLADGATLFALDLGGSHLGDGTVFTIAENTSADPTIGFFKGLSEGTQVAIGSNSFVISYHGGDGNDVTLRSATVPEPASVALLVGGLAALALHLRRRRA
ncbi:MAG: VPLPA-CTERM sorting domain-containing protein, partial [Verrucomicrobiota bacterium]|nr:VPLPA-CTERM sorting domain-containing protein [Verrucomicrobiota bacterium]